jgi:uncharacterized coiled-coil DUF342 family protein
MVSDAEIKKQIDKLKNKLEIEWQALDQIFTEIKSKRDVLNDYKTRRDEFNQIVKELISQGKELQKERDTIRESVKPKVMIIKNLRLNIKEFSKQISELKNIRDGKHREAKGSKVGLKDNVESSLTTLLNLDLSLKDEITLFNMIFSARSRYDAKVVADDAHNQIQEIYNTLKDSENQIISLEGQINAINHQAQDKHNESVTKFKEKDEARIKSNELHQQVLDGYKEMKEYRQQTDEIKKNIAELKGELNVLYKKLRASDRKRLDTAKKEKLEGAKEKLKDKKKMDLDELRLLIESGSLEKEK